MADSPNDGLEVGTLLIMSGRNSGSSVVKVTKLTSTRFSAAYLRLSDLTETDAQEIKCNRLRMEPLKLDAWSHITMRVATPERIEELRNTVRRKNLANKMRDYRWERLPLETLRKVYDVLAEHEAQRNAAAGG